MPPLLRTFHKTRQRAGPRLKDDKVSEETVKQDVFWMRRTATISRTQQENVERKQRMDYVREGGELHAVAWILCQPLAQVFVPVKASNVRLRGTLRRGD